MKRTLSNALTGCLLLPALLTFAQQLPQESLVDWSTAGTENNLPVYDTIDVSAFSFHTDGETPNDDQLATLLDNHTGPVIFQFPAGEFYFEKTINLKAGQVLTGTSATESHFVFDLTEPGHLITIKGNISTDTSRILSEVPKNASEIVIENPSFFQAGDFIKIISLDDDLVTSSWALYSTGQVCRITGIDGNQLTVEPAIRKALSLQNDPKIIRMETAGFAGIECLSIERKDATSHQTSNIFIDHAANCWVKGVRSVNCNFGHITVQNSAHVTVSGSYFQDGFDYGGGGKAYGVVLQFSASDCLVENNIFRHLRHSMLLQAGANGNVLSYNYSTQPFWTGTSLPSNSAGDLVLHGNYSYCNLFEGNIVQNIVIDDSHGANGPGNVFFRNRAELYGIFMNNNPPSDGQLFVGNEITSTLPFTGFYMLSGTGHFEFGNNIKHTIIPASASDLSISSLYLNEAPVYFQHAGLATGSIGLPATLNTGTIPARARFQEGEMTICEFSEPVISGTQVHSAPGSELRIFPNPSSGRVNIRPGDRPESISQIQVFDTLGKAVLQIQADANGTFNLEKLPPGMYFITATTGLQYYSGKITLTE